MTISNACPPHRWDENGAIEGIVLAKCIQCAVRQWHATDGDFDTWVIANKYNKRDHLEIVELKKRRFMDTTLRNDNSDVAVVNTGENTTAKVPEHVDARIQRMRDNRGNSDRFDKLAPQVLDDVKTMTWAAALRKNGIPVGSAGRLRRRWEKMKLLPADTPSKVTKETPRKRDYDAEKAFIISDYETLPLNDFYAMQHLSAGTWTILKKKWGIKGKPARTRKNKVDMKTENGTLAPKSIPSPSTFSFGFTFTVTQDVIEKLLAISFQTIIQKELTK